MPDHRNPAAVIISMTQEEYDRLKVYKGTIEYTLQLLEIGAGIQDKSDSQVTVTLRAAPKDFLGRLFAYVITGEKRFVSMRAEEFAQDLEEYGFTVEFS